MPTAEMSADSAPSQVRSMLRELRNETIPWVLPALWFASFAFYAISSRYSDPLEPILACLVAFAAGVVVWGMRRVSYAASAWSLVAGGITLVLLLATRLGFTPAIFLLSLPVGLATFFVSVPGGVFTAAICSAILFYTPFGLLIPDAGLRIVTLIGLWGTMWLIWLAQRSLLATLDWSWSSTQRSLQLLDEARDQRVQLKEALADLAEANAQLTQLNRLAHNLRQAADDARRVKEQFVTNVSHELRTPLNMVIGFAETILQAPQVYGEGIPAALLADLAIILRNGQHLSSLVDDVLDLSQVEAGQMALIKERVALAEIVEAAATAIRPLFASKGLHLETEVPEELPPIFCDRTRIREVLLNLLSNAGRFTERGGVNVDAQRDGANIVVSVADTGQGIAAADKERLFRPFEQLDGSIRRRYGGTGLGLAISKNFVELHGGTMWLESELGRGTTIFFRLPIDPAGPADSGPLRWLRPDWEFEQPTRPRRLPPSTASTRLVVLEPGRTLQRLLARYLGHVEIVGVTSLEAALEDLARMPAQALLVNDASVGAGLARLQALGGLPHGTPAIICSVPGTHEAAGALGAVDYLLKPISRDSLLGALDRLQIEGKTVLVIDDEPEVARLCRRMLNSTGKGYRVLTATEGREGLAILREERPDVVLLDLVMPDTDGSRVLAEKVQDPAIRDIPVVIISASDPAGQPAVTNALAITRGEGLPMPQFLACLAAIIGSGLSAAPPPDPAPPATSPG